ncbi:carbohydrate kinase [Longirhabdus pacifica]|uniref:carbohydrate kinase n=1 Tax=Longirhabdus pacifica TaxID=2305227 RepID=UPI00100917BB|nr:carbohydrate kinase [Longirhabdus pacifica]
MDKEKQIIEHIKNNPYISQQELANLVNISRSAVAGYIAALTKKGIIKGRAYVLRDEKIVMCIGGANLDRKAYSKQKVTLHTSNPVTIKESCGGVARNIAENLGRLGSTVMLMSGVGDDKEGKLLLQKTKQHGVDVSQVWVFPTQNTGTYTAMLDQDGEMVVSLADMDIYDALTPALFADKWPQINATEVVFIDTNIPEDALQFIIERCKQEDIPLYIDPVSSIKAQKLPHDLSGVKGMMPNLDEAEVLSGISINSTEDAKQACKIMHERGVEQVIITMGEKGVYCSTEHDDQLLPPFSTEVVDVTGAGDAFASGLLYGIVQALPIIIACQLGLAASMLTLQSEQSVSPELSAEKLYSVIKEQTT